MKKVKYNDTYVYVDDSPLDDKETGKLIRDKVRENDLENTLEIQSILSDTSVNMENDSRGIKDE